MIGKGGLAVVFFLLASFGLHAAPRPFDASMHFDPLRISLEEPLPGKLVAGVLLPLRVVVRNISMDEGSRMKPVAVVLRGMQWHDDRIDQRSWLHRTLGTMHEQADGSLMLDRQMQRPGNLWLESAVLFPGEQVVISMPFTVQHGGRQRVEITYGEVPFDRWQGQILLAPPGAESQRFIAFSPATAARIAARQGQGGEAALRSSMQPNPLPLELQREVWSIEMTLRPDPQGVTTGGLNFDAAQHTLGWDTWAHAHPHEKFWGFWRPVLNAWIFVRADGTASALRRERGSWVHEKLPHIVDPALVEEFGSAPQNATRMLLRPDVFGGVLTVATPSQAAYYDVGLTAVPADRLWTVLRVARERGIELRLVTYDANDLGNEQAISAGILIDHRGQWLNPGPEKQYRR